VRFRDKRDYLSKLRRRVSELNSRIIEENNLLKNQKKDLNVLKVLGGLK